MKRRLRCLIGLILLSLCAATVVGSRQLPGQTVVGTIQVGGFPSGIGVNPDTNRIYVANQVNDNVVSVIDGAVNQVIATVPVRGIPYDVGVNPDTNRIYVTNQDSGNHVGIVNVIDGATSRVIATVPVGDFPDSVSVNPDTNRIYVTNGVSGNVSVIDGVTNQVIATVPMGGAPFGVGVNPNTNRIYVTNGVSDNVSVIDGVTNQVIATVPVGGAPFGVGVNPNTNRIYVTNGVSDNVSVIDGASNQVIATVPVGNFPHGVGVNPNTNCVYVVNAGNVNVSVIDGASNQVIALVLVGDFPRGVGVNPNTNRVYVGDSNNNVSVIDGTTNSGAISNKANLRVIFHGGIGSCLLFPYTVLVKETNGVGVTITSYKVDGTNHTTEEFVSNFKDCGSKKDGFIPGFDAACFGVVEPATFSTRVWTFFGTDQNGNSIEASGSIEIRPGPIGHPFSTAAFTASPTRGSVPLTVRFFDLSTGTDSIDLWSWSFGDGCTSTEQNPVHTYTKIGNFDVSLTVTIVSTDPCITCAGGRCSDTETIENFIRICPRKPSELSLTVTPTKAVRSLRPQVARVKAQDKDGKLVPNLTINASASGRQAMVIPLSATTDDNGEADFTFRFGLITNKGVITFTTDGVKATITQKQ